MESKRIGGDEVRDRGDSRSQLVAVNRIDANDTDSKTSDSPGPEGYTSYPTLAVPYTA